MLIPLRWPNGLESRVPFVPLSLQVLEQRSSFVVSCCLRATLPISPPLGGRHHPIVTPGFIRGEIEYRFNVKR
jgi:hypothetical protein